MTETPVAAADRLFAQAFDALDAIATSGGADERIAVLSRYENVVRRADRATVSTVADLERLGVFAERGYKSSAAALADLLGWERFEARRRVVAAEQVVPRIRDGLPEFIPPKWIDPLRTPRQKALPQLVGMLG